MESFVSADRTRGITTVDITICRCTGNPGNRSAESGDGVTRRNSVRGHSWGAEGNGPLTALCQAGSLMVKRECAEGVSDVVRGSADRDLN